MDNETARKMIYSARQGWFIATIFGILLTILGTVGKIDPPGAAPVMSLFGGAIIVAALHHFRDTVRAFNELE